MASTGSRVSGSEKVPAFLGGSKTRLEDLGIKRTSMKKETIQMCWWWKSEDHYLDEPRYAQTAIAIKMLVLLERYHSAFRLSSTPLPIPPPISSIA